MKRALVPVADGTTESEAVVLAEVLRRAGVEVVIAASSPGAITGGFGLRLLPDATFAELRGQAFELIAIPGGWRGVQRLEADEQFHELVEAHVAAKRPVAAVCSAPNLLRRWGYVGDAQRFTAHPASLGFATGGQPQSDSIVREPLLITGVSAAATLPWALAVVEQLWGSALRQEVEEKMGPA